MSTNEAPHSYLGSESQAWVSWLSSCRTAGASLGTTGGISPKSSGDPAAAGPSNGDSTPLSSAYRWLWSALANTAAAPRSTEAEEGGSCPAPRPLLSPRLIDPSWSSPESPPVAACSSCCSGPGLIAAASRLSRPKDPVPSANDGSSSHPLLLPSTTSTSGCGGPEPDSCSLGGVARPAPVARELSQVRLRDIESCRPASRSWIASRGSRGPRNRTSGDSLGAGT